MVSNRRMLCGMVFMGLLLLALISGAVAWVNNAPAPEMAMPAAPDHTAELLAAKEATADAQTRQVATAMARPDFNPMSAVVYEPEGK